MRQEPAVFGPRTVYFPFQESDEEDEEDSDAEDPDHDLARDYRLVDCPISALRLDALAKVALGISRM